MRGVLFVLQAPLRGIRRIYGWTIHWARTPHAPLALFGIAFAESSFFPVPPDVLLIAMTIASPKMWWRNALICTVGSVTGALLGYLIGWGLFETVGQWIVSTYRLESHVETVGRLYADNAFGAIFTAAFTPIPYKVFTIAAGLFKISLPTLIVASLFGRAGRFFLVAGLLRLFGEKIERFIERYFDLISIVFVVLLFGSYFLIKTMRH
ncbi:MAG: DedA family protein [Elusimicrobia bacterium]|nr:DedA family protein [Elusimicrobiota bacterium]